MVRILRVGEGLRSRAMSHWKIGRRPDYDDGWGLNTFGGHAVEHLSKHIPQILKNIRASLMMLPSFASLSAERLKGALRMPALCWRRARHCRNGTRSLTVY